MKKDHIKLTDKNRKALSEILEKGSLQSRTCKSIIGLLELDKGKTYQEANPT